MIVIIGGINSEHVSLEIESRTYPDSADYWDGNWLNARVQFQLGCFRGAYGCHLRAEDFVAFHDQIVILSQKLTGHAVFKTMEEQVAINFEADGQGHISVTGALQDEAGIGNTLQFRFEIDQTFLEKMLKELQAIVTAFPVKGSA
jgi:hypothetical protein